uniref:WSN domain-containing protein n=1 Tax=Caenorhabditis tropicalis TaxID=1561998 RepID=A0A1I7UPF1_9PELO
MRKIVSLLFAVVAVITAAPVTIKSGVSKELEIRPENGRDYSGGAGGSADYTTQLPNFIAERLLHHRQKRGTNDDPFSDLQTRISTFARVVNGITVYNGIFDGSTPIDSIISELMGVGSFNLQDLMSFNPDEVKKAVKKINEVKISNTTRDIGRHVVNLFKIKEMYQKAGSLNSLPNEAAIKALNSLNGSDLQKINTISVDSKATLTELSTAIEKLMKIVEEKRIMETLEALEPFNRYVQLIQFSGDYEINSLKNFNQSEKDQLQTELEELGKIPKESSSVLQLMYSVAGSSSIKREFTSGFVNGYEDLGRLTDDIDDDWIKELIGNHTSLNELTQLTTLVDPIKQLDGKWKPARSPPLRMSIQKAAMIEDSFGNFTGIGKTVVDVIASFKISPSSRGILMFSAMKVMSIQSGLLVYKLATLKSLQAKISSQLNTSDTLNPQYFAEIKQLIDEVKAVPKVEELGDQLSQGAQFVTGFQSTFADFIAYFDSLNGFTSLSKEAITAVKVAIQISDIQNDNEFTNNIDSISSSITASIDLLTEVNSTIETIKAKTANKNLVQLKDLSKHSKSLCDASSIIDMMQKLLDKSSALSDIAKNGYFVDDNVGKTTPGVKNKIGENWQDFYELRHKIFQLLPEARAKRNEVVKPKTENLEDYGPILEQFSGLENVDLDVEHRIVAVDALYPKVAQTDQPPLESLKASLEQVADLDLSFSKYSISGISKSLTSIQKVFLSTIPTVTVMPTTPKPAQKGKQIQVVMTTEAPPKKDENLIWYILGSVVVILVIAGILSYIFRSKLASCMPCKKKKKEQESSSSEGEYSDNNYEIKKRFIDPEKEEKNGRRSRERNPSRNRPAGNRNARQNPDPNGRREQSPAANQIENPRPGGHQIRNPSPAGNNNQNLRPNVNRNQNLRPARIVNPDPIPVENGNRNIRPAENRNRNLRLDGNENGNPGAPRPPAQGMQPVQHVPVMEQLGLTVRAEHVPVLEQLGLVEERPRDEYFDDQDEDDTLRCVQSITN